MATVKILPSSYTMQGSSDFIANPENMYTDTTSTTYAAFLPADTTYGSLTLTGFDFTNISIPSGSTIQSVVAKVKIRKPPNATYASAICSLQRVTSPSSTISDQVTLSYVAEGETVTLTPTVTYEQLVANGCKLQYIINGTGASGETRIYGAEIVITYELPPDPVPNKVDYVKDGVTKTLIDLTSDTVTAADVLSGVLFHLPSGEQATGSLVPPSGGLEYESGTWSPSSNTTTAPTIYFASEHSEPPAVMVMSDTSTSTRAQNYFISWFYINYEKIIEDWAKPSGSNWRSWYNMCSYATSATAESIYSASASTTPMVFKGNFSPYIYGKSLRAGRVYNWIAIWAPDYS